jgi:hypothetical protein
LCGGYWAKELNLGDAPLYVSGLDLSAVSLSDNLSQDLTAASGEWVAAGVVGTADPQFHVSKLVVTDLYRGLPLDTDVGSDGYFTVPLGGCPSGSCASAMVQRLNVSEAPDSYAVDLAPATMPGVQPDWLLREVESKGALLAASRAPSQDPGGTPTLAVQQIYLRLTGLAQACPAFAPLSCDQGQVPSYNRDANRCFAPVACVANPTCTGSTPSCPDGYAASVWTEASDGCNTFACDPAWLNPVSP